MGSGDEEWTDLDWRTYQKLVAGLHADEETEVETEYEYPIPGSGDKEVDVVVWDRSEHYEYTVLIECKFHDDPLSQSVVQPVSLSRYQSTSPSRSLQVNS